MTLITSRRSFLIGFGALIAAPAIVRAASIMPVKQMLILPDRIADITFPIEGYMHQSPEYREIYGKYLDGSIGRGFDMGWHRRTLVKPTAEKFAEFKSRRWTGKDVPTDTDERWERLKKRERGSVIWNGDAAFRRAPHESDLA